VKQPASPRRRLSSAEGKRHATAARARANVKYEQIASALCVSHVHCKDLFTNPQYMQLGYGDLFLLARAPETAGMVREMLAPLLELIDQRNLRLSDLEGMARSTATAQLALAILRPTFDALEPLRNLSDTKVKP